MQPYKVWLFSDLIEKTKEYLKFLFISEIMIGLIYNVKSYIKTLWRQVKGIISILREL